MPVEKSVNAYRKKRLNCAQSIYHGFQLEHNIDESRVAAASAFGGGRAPQGLCGALHAAASLVSKQQVMQFRNAFASQAGAQSCRDIRKLGHYTCVQCVQLAAELLCEIKDKNEV